MSGLLTKGEQLNRAATSTAPRNGIFTASVDAVAVRALMCRPPGFNHSDLKPVTHVTGRDVSPSGLNATSGSQLNGMIAYQDIATNFLTSKFTRVACLAFPTWQITRRPSKIGSGMRFTIVALLWLTLYVALVLTSLRYPTGLVTGAIQLFSVASIAVAAVIAFDRRSTPIFSFVVFSIAAALNLDIGSGIVIETMAQLKIKTGSTEYANLEKQLYYHLVIAAGLLGIAFGCVVRQLGTSKSIKQIHNSKA